MAIAFHFLIQEPQTEMSMFCKLLTLQHLGVKMDGFTQIALKNTRWARWHLIKFLDTQQELLQRIRLFTKNSPFPKVVGVFEVSHIALSAYKQTDSILQVKARLFYHDPGCC